MKQKLDHYKIFYTVGKYKNISKASEKLYISQPAVSKSIKLLEESLEINLFYRTSKGVQLTNEGELLFSYIEKAIQNIDEGEKIIERLKNNEIGSVKIGVSTTLCKLFLLPKLNEFKKIYPNVNILIINKSANETINLVNSGEVDIGIISNIKEYNQFNTKTIGTIHDIFITNPNFPNYKNINTLEKLKETNALLLLNKDNISRKYIDEYFKNNNIEITPYMELNNMDLLVELTKINLGICIAIKELVKTDLKNNTLVEIYMNNPIPPRSVIAINNKKLPLPIASNSFWDFL